MLYRFDTANDPPLVPVPDPIINLMPIGTTPAPPTIPKLGKGERYVFSCKVKCEVDVSPDGLVALVEKPGPRDFTGWFSGGSGVDEDRTFAGPFLYELKATGVGQAKVTLIPLPYNGSGKVKMLFDVDNGGPPIPPMPPIPPTPPVDALTLQLKAAFAADHATIDVPPKLAKVYRNVASVTSQDKTLTTWQALMGQIKRDQDAAVPPATINAVRKVIGDELVAAIPNLTVPLDRTLVQNTFNRLAQALEGVH